MALYRRTSDIGIRTLSDNGFENKEMQVDPVGVGGGHEDEESDVIGMRRCGALRLAIPYVSVSTQWYYMFLDYSKTNPNRLVAYYAWKKKGKKCVQMLLH